MTDTIMKHCAFGKWLDSALLVSYKPMMHADMDFKDHILYHAIKYYHAVSLHMHTKATATVQARTFFC